MSIRRINAIFQKQIKDTLKNKIVFIQFVMLPLMAIIMENSVKLQDMPGHFFVIIFSAMYVGMAPLTSMASIISEERETNTLRVLLMSNVKAAEYLLGVGSYIWFICMLGSGVLALAGGYTGVALVQFLGVMCVGIITSILIGAAIGVLSRNQMTATSITVPVMMIFSFLPLIATFNDSVKKVSCFLYSQQIQDLLNHIGSFKVTAESVFVISGNILVVMVLFLVFYRQSKFN